MSIDNDLNSSDRDSLGRAANRYVSFQIGSAIVGVIVFLILLFTVFLPQMNRMNQAMPSPGQMPTGMTVGPGGPSATSVTVNGRPATPGERKEIEQHLNNVPALEVPAK